MIIEREDLDNGQFRYIVKIPNTFPPPLAYSIPVEEFRPGAIIRVSDEEIITPLVTLDAMRADWV